MNLGWFEYDVRMILLCSYMFFTYVLYDFEIIEQLEFEYGIKKSILPGDMKLCNKLYNKYKII